jgi:hypothetical protein
MNRQQRQVAHVHCISCDTRWTVRLQIWHLVLNDPEWWLRYPHCPRCNLQTLVVTG